MEYTRKLNETKIFNFIATHSTDENYLNNIVRSIEISKKDAIIAIKSLLKSKTIEDAESGKKKCYSVNSKYRDLLISHYSSLRSNIEIFDDIMNKLLNEVKGKDLFIKNDELFIKYKNKKTEKVLSEIFQIIDSIFSAVSSLPFLQIAGFIENDDENNFTIQKYQKQTYTTIDKIIQRLKNEHVEEQDRLNSLLFLKVKLISQIMSLKGEAV